MAAEKEAALLRRRARALGYRPMSRGIGSLYLRGGSNGVWWLSLWAHGERIRISTGIRGGSPGHPPREAEMFRAEKLHELGKGGLLGLRSDSLTVGDLLDILLARYEAEQRSSLPGIRQRLSYLRKRHGGWKVKDFTLDRMLGYAVRRRDLDKAAVATVNLELAYLRRAFGVAVEAGRLQSIPRVPRLPGSRVRQGFIEESAYNALLEALPALYRPPVRFLRLTGWRVNEALRLTWDRVGWVAEEIRLDTSKTGAPRSLPFSSYPPLRDLLLEQRAAADAAQVDLGVIIRTVFWRQDGLPIMKGALQAAWAQARKRAGFPNLILHDFRRTLVRDMERAGVSRSVACRITGHKSERVYSRYAIVARQDVEDGLRKLVEAPKDERVVSFRR